MWKKRIKVLVGIMLAGIFIYLNSVEAEAAKQGVIVIGDSRTVELSKNCDFEDVFFVAKGGEGYDYFVQKAIGEVDAIMSNNLQYTKWNIISHLGYNDMSRADEFIELYNDLTEDSWKNCNFYILGLTPVNDDQIKKYFIGDPDQVSEEFLESWGSRYTANVVEFNNKMKESGLTYIDVYDAVKQKFTPTDGIHYRSYEANHFILEQMLTEIQYVQNYEETSKIITEPYTLHTMEEIASSLDQVLMPVTDVITDEISENLVE